MARGAMAEGEGDGAPWPLGANPGRPRIAQRSAAARGEMGGQGTFLPRPKGEEEVVEEAEAEYCVMV